MHAKHNSSRAAGRSLLKASTSTQEAALSPIEALQLHDEMLNHCDPASLAHLAPEVYFAPPVRNANAPATTPSLDIFIDQSRARAWASELQAHLYQQPDNSRAAAQQAASAQQAVAQALLASVVAKLQEQERVLSGTAAHLGVEDVDIAEDAPLIAAHGFSSSVPYLQANLMDLLLELDATDRLPVIAFCLSRRGCERLVLQVAGHLEAMARKHAPRLAHADRDDSEREEKVKKLVKMREQVQGQKARKGGSRDATDALNDEVAELEAELGAGTRPDPHFTFTGAIYVSLLDINKYSN